MAGGREEGAKDSRRQLGVWQRLWRRRVFVGAEFGTLILVVAAAAVVDGGQDGARDSHLQLWRVTEAVAATASAWAQHFPGSHYADEGVDLRWQFWREESSLLMEVSVFCGLYSCCCC